jgi:AcrR family transcriptional regulator
MGRHRQFDPDEVLDAALDVFWRQGFEGTSVADLTAATGVAAPGLYAAFGNKEALFLKALDRYQEGYLAEVACALSKPGARVAIEEFLRRNAKRLVERDHPGCMGINGAIACSDGAESVRLELVRRRQGNEAMLCQRLKQAKTDGDLPPDVTPEDLARYLMTVSQGMAVHAKAGASLKELNRVIDLALKFWP